jgi:hypothetical protein
VGANWPLLLPKPGYPRVSPRRDLVLAGIPCDGWVYPPQILPRGYPWPVPYTRGYVLVTLIFVPEGREYPRVGVRARPKCSGTPRVPALVGGAVSGIRASPAEPRLGDFQPKSAARGRISGSSRAATRPSTDRPSPCPRLEVQGNSRLGRDRLLPSSLSFPQVTHQPTPTKTTNTTMLDPLLQQLATPPAQEASTLPIDPLQIQSKRPRASPIEETN